MSIKQCGSASGCLTVPQNCGSDTEEECDIALSYKSVTGGVRFRLTSRQPDASYVALGISTDQMMVREREGRINAQAPHRLPETINLQLSVKFTA